jgi:hypothetical protein
MKTVISYAYYETLKAAYNLDFFAKTGVFDNDDYLFVFVINGQNCNVEIPHYKNCVVITRDNIGYDFGAHYVTIDYLTTLYKCPIESVPFDNFVFLNCSVMGPFLPSYISRDVKWPDLFTSRLTDKIKLVGTSIVCFGTGHIYGAGPYVEGFCFALDKISLKALCASGKVFINHKTKDEAIYLGEYGLTNVIHQNGWNVDCLLYKYNGTDWSDPQNRLIASRSNYPTRHLWYDGISINPFEVVFHKWFWENNPTVSFNETKKYREWQLKNLFGNFNVEYGTNEMRINITGKFEELYRKSNKIIIDPKTNFEKDFGSLYELFIKTDPKSILNVYITINKTLYKLQNMTDSENPKIYFLTVPPEFKLKVSYGSDSYKIDVTDIFLNSFNIKGLNINIPQDISFNDTFGDPHKGQIKKLFVAKSGVTYVISEKRSTDFNFVL